MAPDPSVEKGWAQARPEQELSGHPSLLLVPEHNLDQSSLQYP